MDHAGYGPGWSGCARYSVGLPSACAYGSGPCHRIRGAPFCASCRPSAKDRVCPYNANKAAARATASPPKDECKFDPVFAVPKVDHDGDEYVHMCTVLKGIRRIRVRTGQAAGGFHSFQAPGTWDQEYPRQVIRRKVGVAGSQRRMLSLNSGPRLPVPSAGPQGSLRGTPVPVGVSLPA